jgi:hypothetical protein
VFIVVSVYFVIDSVRKLLVIPPYSLINWIKNSESMLYNFGLMHVKSSSFTEFCIKGRVVMCVLSTCRSYDETDKTVCWLIIS